MDNISGIISWLLIIFFIVFGIGLYKMFVGITSNGLIGG